MSKVLVLPFSGGTFPVQLGLLTELVQTSYRPHITLGTSGGNVCAYVASAAQWSQHGIERIGSQIHSGMLIKSWWPSLLSFLPSWLLGVFRSSLYYGAQDIQQFFQQHFNSSTITCDEIWTGCSHAGSKRATIFCNLSPENSRLPVHQFNATLTACEPLQFHSGDVPLIACTSLASASIPGIVPNVLIGDSYYMDGGAMYASPFIPLLDILPDPCHVIYINGRDDIPNFRDFEVSQCSPVEDKADKEEKGEKADEGEKEEVDDTKCHLNRRSTLSYAALRLEQFLNSLITQDRLAAVRNLKKWGVVKYSEGSCNLEKLQELRNIADQAVASVLELLPAKNQSVDLFDFTGEEVCKVMKLTADDYCYRLWTVSEEKMPTIPPSYPYDL